MKCWQVLYDCLDEAVRELRVQIKKKDTLEELADSLKESLVQRDTELEVMRTDSENLRKQKDALMRAIG